MRPLALSDRQLDQIFAAARPLCVSERDAFLQAVADALQDVVDPGDGDVHRAVMAAQREHWDPPLVDKEPQHWGRRATG